MNILKKAVGKSVSAVLAASLIFAGCTTFTKAASTASLNTTSSSESALSSATAAAESSAEDTSTVVDALGREVTIPATINSVAILPAPWASVVYALNGSGDIVKGIQAGAKNLFESSMLKKLAPEIEESNTGFFVDGQFNYEELAKIDPDVMILFTRQSDFIDKLTEIGIPVVTIEYATSFDSLWKDFEILGDVLNKQDRAKQFIDYQKKDVQYFEEHSDTYQADPVKVMQIYTADPLTVTDNSGINNDIIKYAGGENVGASGPDAQSETEVNMEQVLSWNPDVIIIGNWDDVTPEDFYNNTIDGEDWSNVNAIKNKRVYKIPKGIYNWDGDSPCIETSLYLKWLAKVINPSLSQDIDIKQETKDFYSNFFNYNLTDEEVDTILATEQNAQSASIEG